MKIKKLKKQKKNLIPLKQNYQFSKLNLPTRQYNVGLLKLNRFKAY